MKYLVFCLILFSSFKSKGQAEINETNFWKVRDYGIHLSHLIQQGDKVKLWKALKLVKLPKGSKERVNLFLDDEIYKEDKVYIISDIALTSMHTVFQIDLYAFKFLADSVKGDRGQFYFSISMRAVYDREREEVRLLDGELYSLEGDADAERWWKKKMSSYNDITYGRKKIYAQFKLPPPPPPPIPVGVVIPRRNN